MPCCNQFAEILNNPSFKKFVPPGTDAEKEAWFQRMELQYAPSITGTVAPEDFKPKK